MDFLCHTHTSSGLRLMGNAFESQLCDDHICGLDNCVVRVSGLLAADGRMPLIQAQCKRWQEKARERDREQKKNAFRTTIFICSFYYSAIIIGVIVIIVIIIAGRVLLFDKNAKEVDGLGSVRLYFYSKLQINIESNENARNENSADIDEQLQ